MRYLIIFLLVLKLSAFTKYDIRPKGFTAKSYKNLILHDSILLKDQKIDGLKFCEISDMAYDADSGFLYMLSDKAKIFWAQIYIKNNQINYFDIKGGKRLKGYGGKKLLKPYRDSEGMDLIKDKNGKKRLLISFERKPRVSLYSLNGEFIRSLKLPRELRDIDKYRGRNRALEALAYSKKRGIITSPEKPLRKYSKKYHRIYDKDGVICKIRKQDKNNSLVEMEMMDDNHILVLFRHFHPASFGFDTTLKEIDFTAVKDGCKTKELAHFSTKNGWNIDNFEGLTKVGKNLYLMVSDSNQNSFENMILTLFSIKEK